MCHPHVWVHKIMCERAKPAEVSTAEALIQKRNISAAGEEESTFTRRN